MVITRQDLITLVSDDKNILSLTYSDLAQALKQCKETERLEIFNFYDKCRKSYNQKKSKVYINIVQETEDPKKVLTTLSALVTQILLFAENVSHKEIFLKHARLYEILETITEYAKTNDLTNCIKLLFDIKQDVKYLEQL